MPEEALPYRQLPLFVSEVGTTSTRTIEKRPLAPDRNFGEIQFLVADVDDAVVLEKEIGSE